MVEAMCITKYIILKLTVVTFVTLSANTSFNHTTETCFQQSFVDQCRCFCTDHCQQPKLCCDTDNRTSGLSGNFTPDFHQYFNCDSQILSPHLIVTRCPDDWNDHTTRHLCEKPSPATQRDTFPVTAARFGFEMTFRNKHCAICHSELKYENTPLYYNIRTCPVFFVFLLLTEKELFSLDHSSFFQMCDKYIPDSIKNIANHCTCQNRQDDSTNNDLLVQMIDRNDMEIKPIFTPNCSSISSFYGRTEECELGFTNINGTCQQFISTDKCLDKFTFISTFDMYVADFLQSLNIMKAIVNHGWLKQFDTLKASGLEYLWVTEYERRRYTGHFKESGDSCVAFYTDIIYVRPDGNEMLQLKDVFDSCACNFEFVDREGTLDHNICEIRIDIKFEDISGFTQLGLEDSIKCTSGNSSNTRETFQYSKYLGCGSRIHTNNQFITKCRDDWKDERIRHKCEIPNSNFLEEMVPVVLYINNTDLIMTFRNQFCAICHDLYQYRTLPIIVDALDCKIEPRLRKYLQSNMTITGSIASLLQDDQCDLYVFAYGSDVFEPCLCGTTSPPQHIAEIFTDETQIPTVRPNCTKSKETGMPKWHNCGFGNMEIAGQCRRLFQLNTCVVNYRFVYPVLNGDSMDKTLFYPIINMFYSYIRRSEQVFMISESLLVPGFTNNKKKCVEIYVDVLFHQPLDDDQQASLDTFIQFPCPDVRNCTVSFLPLGHLLLDRFCNTSSKLVQSHDLENASTSFHVNSIYVSIAFVLLNAMNCLWF